MKKTIALILAPLLAISAAGCAGGTQDASSPEVSLSGEIGGEITISCYDTMGYKAFLEDAAKLFEEKHPGTKVHIEAFSAMPETKTFEQDGKHISAVMVQDDPQGRADYIGRMGAGLMSGGGADILAMDVLPVYKYAQSGQLENLADYMRADPNFNRADYRENILEAAEYRGGTWFLPLDYSFEYYAYDSTLFTGGATSGFGTGSAFDLWQLIGMAKPLFDGTSRLLNLPGYSKGGGGGLFGRLLEESYASFVDLEGKSANFEDGGFEELLLSVGEYTELGYIPQGVTGQAEPGELMRKSGDPQTDRYFFKPKNNFSLVQQYNRDSGRKMNIMTGGSAGAIEDDDEIAGIRADKDGSVPFTYSQAYGINANSANKETAWEFIKFLLGEEMQLSNKLSAMALPLNNSARGQKAEMLLSGAFMGHGEPLDEAQREVLQKYTRAVEELSDQINSHTLRDSTVDDMIAAEAGYFFDGSKSAGEAAKMLQSKAKLYLGE